MFIGILFTLLACLCWGFMFILPNLLTGFNPIEIALGRFLFFGIISLVILLVRKRHLLNKSYRRAWVSIIGLSFVSTLLCYICLVAGIRYSSAALVALIFGMSPITIALLGNWVKKEFSTKKFTLPLSLMALGVILVNLEAFNFSGVSIKLYSFGALSGLFGLGAWTWYAVANSQFMEKNKDLTPFDSVVMLGSATFVLVMVAIGIFAPLFCDFSKYAALTPQLKRFIGGTLLLGIVSSWVAYYFWNIGSLRLPISLVGQLSIFEMIFGLVFIYLFEKRIPAITEIAGILLMTIGIFSAFFVLKRVSKEQIQIQD